MKIDEGNTVRVKGGPLAGIVTLVKAVDGNFVVLEDGTQVHRQLVEHYEAPKQAEEDEKASGDEVIAAWEARVQRLKAEAGARLSERLGRLEAILVEIRDLPRCPLCNADQTGDEDEHSTDCLLGQGWV